MHIVEALVDLTERPAVGDIRVDFKLAIEVVFDQSRNFCPALNATESRSAPYTTSDELEWSGGDFLSSGSHTDDSGNTPALVTSLQSSAHDMNVTSAIEREVQSSVGDCDEMILDLLSFSELEGVDEVGGTELLGPRFLARVSINGYDPAGTDASGRVDDTKTNCTTAKDSHGRILDAGLLDHSPPCSGDTATEKANLLERSLGVDSHNRDVGYDGVLREC